MKTWFTSLRRGCLLSMLAALTLTPRLSPAASPVLHSDGPNGQHRWWVSEAAWPYCFLVEWEGDRGDLIRTNPDGTITYHMEEAACSFKLILYNGRPNFRDWPVVAEGVGMTRITCDMIKVPGGYSATGERWDAHSIADLTFLETGEVARLYCQFVQRDWEVHIYRLQYEPMGWDILWKK